MVKGCNIMTRLVYMYKVVAILCIRIWSFIIILFFELVTGYNLKLYKKVSIIEDIKGLNINWFSRPIIA